MFSIIVPAHNEESLLGGTLESLNAAVQTIGEPHEIIVVNDASTDRTAEVARSRGAQVIDVNLRHIAAVRNAGAKAARGDVLIFVDADTSVPAATLHAALEAMKNGAVGGGSRVDFEGHIPFLAWLYLKLFMIIWRPLKLAAGCFVFCRREAFEAIGGFDERYFASEEIWLSKALKRQGKFVIIAEPVITSSRKGRMYSPREFVGLSVQLLWKGQKAWQKREGLELWYEGRRETVEEERRIPHPPDACPPTDPAGPLQGTHRNAVSE